MNYSKFKKHELISILRVAEKVDSPNLAYNYIRKMKFNYHQENFIVLLLNNNNEIIKGKILFKGGISETVVDPKIIFHEALSLKFICGVIVAHNHPSGNLCLSQHDIETMNRLNFGAKLLGLSLLDFLIITPTTYSSMREAGKLN